MRITYQELLRNPELYARLRQEAHRERARAIHDFVKSLFARHRALVAEGIESRSVQA